jgi:hypothetical protein
MERSANMNPTKTNPSSGKLTVVTVIAVMLFVGACASGTILKWNQVDSAAMMKSDTGKQKLDTVRFETYGPDAEQLFGYFLYKDGIEVITGEGIPQKRLGKLTIGEVMDDYARAVKARQFSSGSNLIVREVLRSGLVVGYTANDINMDVSIWDITADTDAKVVLRLVYRDLRKKEGGDMRRNMNPAGR